MTAASAGAVLGDAGRRLPAVLVTDGGERAALAVVRSLGTAGYEVHVAAASARAMAARSRWARAVVVTPDPLRDSETFVEVVASYAADRRIAIVIPITDAAMWALLANRERLEGCVIPFGSLDAFHALANKAGLRDVAARCGIAFPSQRELPWAERDQVDDVPIPLPVVIKPARSVAELDGRRAKFGVLHAATGVELRHAIESLPRAAYPLLIQERVVGPGIGIFLLVWDGRLVATFAHRRLREKPPSGGVSVYAESMPAPEDLVERSCAMLRELAWCGVAMVEYKVDARTGTPYLMEINGRFWGSLQLAVDAGVDFPRLLVECAAGGVPTAVPSYHIGLRERWWWGDVDHLIARLRHSDTALALPPGAGSRLGAVREFVATCARRGPDAVWRRDDPRPFMAETVQWFRRR